MDFVPVTFLTGEHLFILHSHLPFPHCGLRMKKPFHFSNRFVSTSIRIVGRYAFMGTSKNVQHDASLRRERKSGPRMHVNIRE
jgi:hypothetical protein